MSKIHFLPNDYEAPKSASSYMKLDDGVNRVRILSQPILGWEDWHDKKPVRFPYDQKPDESFDPKRPVKHFWAMIVWNYTGNAIQILHITQASIRKGVEALVNDTEWGPPYFYDLKITKKGEGVDTEYTVNPGVPSPVAPEIRKAFADKPIWLDALFDNGDPFKPSQGGQITPGIFEAATTVVEPTESKKRASKAVQAVPDTVVEDEGMELEVFMDFLPDTLTRPKVEEYVELCANHLKVTPEAYMGRAVDNVSQFVTYMNQWLALPKNRKAAS